MAKLIPLRSKKNPGYFAIVDDEDFDALIKFKWRANRTKYFIYAIRGNQSKVNMQNQILGVNGIIDHKNHHTLDNRRKNLRPCSYAQNSWNRSIKRTKRGDGGFKGVYRNRLKYQMQICIGGTKLRINNFTTPTEAALVYNILASILFGEFACLNFSN